MGQINTEFIVLYIRLRQRGERIPPGDRNGDGVTHVVPARIAVAVGDNGEAIDVYLLAIANLEERLEIVDASLATIRYGFKTARRSSRTALAESRLVPWLAALEAQLLGVGLHWQLALTGVVSLTAIAALRLSRAGRALGLRASPVSRPLRSWETLARCLCEGSNEVAVTVVGLDGLLLALFLVVRGYHRALRTVDTVDGEAVRVHQESRGLRLNERLKGLVTHRRIRLLEAKQLIELLWEDRVQVGLHLLVVRPRASCIDELLHLVLELSDAHNDLLQGLDEEVATDCAHLVPQDLEADPTTVVQETSDPSPGLESHERVGLLEHVLGLTANAVREEAPDGTVQGVGVVGLVAFAVPRAKTIADGSLISLLRDDFCLTLGPLENGIDGWDDGDKVSLRFAFPLVAALVGVELKFGLTGNLVVEDPSGS